MINYSGASVYVVSKMQKVVTLISTEAEYMALSEGCKSIAWLRRVLSDLRVKEHTSVITQDNTGCKKWAKSGPARDIRNRKDIKLGINYVQELIERNEIKLKYV